MPPDAGDRDQELHFDTRAVKDGEAARPGAPSPGDVSAPLHLATTYALEEPIEDRPWTAYEPADNEYVYSRVANPTRHALEERLASLHDAEDAVAFASGLAAISATVMAAVEPGDHVVAFEQVYHCQRERPALPVRWECSDKCRNRALNRAGVNRVRANEPPTAYRRSRVSNCSFT